MGILISDQLKQLFPEHIYKNVRSIDMNNLSQEDKYVFGKMGQEGRDVEFAAADSLILGVYRFEKFISNEPEILEDKGLKITGIGTWKEKPDEEFQEGFKIETRMNPLVYQLNSDNFLKLIPNAKTNSFGSAELRIENFNFLIGKEIWVTHVSVELNKQGKSAYVISWKFI